MKTSSNKLHQFSLSELKSVYLLVFICYLMPLFVSAASCQATSDRQTVWQEFRAKNPYNYQTVGMKQYSDGSALIIISEPAENVSINGLNSIFNKLSLNVDIKTYSHPMGFDGWVKDAVIAIDNIQSAKVDELKKELFGYIYGTDYKAAFLNLNVIPKHTNYSAVDLNLQVSAEELQKWFIDQQEILRNVDTGNTIKFTDCFGNHSGQAVYYTDKPGFVVWIINRNSIEKGEFRINARKFSLDSDLIFGAISRGNTIAIIGRERTVPVYVLPPMRSETLQLLASTSEKELAQSYERNNIFAGKLSNHKDYAPIYLSDELWHTEYGSILNITDQMLKSWSENGRIQYDGFDYSSPIDWAFSSGVFHDLQTKFETSELTYNWNTSGAGYWIDSSTENPYTIYAVNRTGSLPVSYIPDESAPTSETNPVYQAEELAYDFFSGLSNPELVKVAQYAIMYQIFTNYSINIPSEELSYTNIVTSKANEKQLTTILNSICDFHNRDYDFSDEGKNYNPIQSQIIEDYFDDAINELLNKCSNHSDSILAFAILLSDPSGTFMNSIDSINSILYPLKDKVVIKNTALTALEILDELGDNIDDTAAIQQAIKKRGIPFLSSVSHFMINPREIDLSSISTKHIYDYTAFELSQIIALMLNKNHKNDINTYASILGIQELEDAEEEYVKENKGKSLSWIKCPTIVQSICLDEDSIFSVGGHDLDSRILPVKIDKTIQAGSYRIKTDNVKGEKVIYISPVDKGYITSDFLSSIKHSGDKEGTYSFEKAKLVPRQRDAVAAVTAKRTDRGFNVPDHLNVLETNTDGQLLLNGKIIDNTYDLFHELAYNSDNKTGTSPKQLIFKGLSEDMIQTIIDGTHSYTLTRGNEYKIPNSCYNFSKAKYKNNKDGSTLVSIPIEGTGIKAEESAHIFKVPTSKIEGFKEAIKELINNPQGVWNQFLYKIKMKNHGIQREELEDYIKYNKLTLIIDFKNKEYYYVEFIEEDIA